jgi:hypothetical protein
MFAALMLQEVAAIFDQLVNFDLSGRHQHEKSRHSIFRGNP